MEPAQNVVNGESILDFVPFFKAFCNPIRAQIMEFLLGGERCVCEMTGPLDQSQPLVSHHLALLRENGMLKTRNEANRTYYSINWDRFDRDLESFVQFVATMRADGPREFSGDACARVATSKTVRKRGAEPLEA